MGNKGSKSIPHLLTRMCVHNDRHKYKGIPGRDIMIIHGDRKNMYMYLTGDDTLPVDRPQDIYDYIVTNGMMAGNDCRYLIDGNVLMLHTDNRILIADRLPFMAHVYLSPRSGGISLCGIPAMMVPSMVLDDIHDWMSRYMR